MKYTDKKIIEKIIELIKFNDNNLHSTPVKTLNKIRELLKQRRKQ